MSKEEKYKEIRYNLDMPLLSCFIVIKYVLIRMMMKLIAAPWFDIVLVEEIVEH